MFMNDSIKPYHSVDLSLSQLLERYATLRDTILGLEAEKEALGKAIKTALQNGEHAETDLYRASLRITKRIEYPIDRFREAFGDAAALEASNIDRRKAEDLAKAGDLDGEHLKEIAKTKEVHALVLQAKTQ